MFLYLLYTTPSDIQLSYEEVTHVIKCLKNHKAPGTDQILAEFLKKGGETLWRRIHHLIKLNWTQHKIPEEWCVGIIQLSAPTLEP